MSQQLKADDPHRMIAEPFVESLFTAVEDLVDAKLMVDE